MQINPSRDCDFVLKIGQSSWVEINVSEGIRPEEKTLLLGARRTPPPACGSTVSSCLSSSERTTTTATSCDGGGGAERLVTSSSMFPVKWIPSYFGIDEVCAPKFSAIREAADMYLELRIRSVKESSGTDVFSHVLCDEPGSIEAVASKIALNESNMRCRFKVTHANVDQFSEFLSEGQIDFLTCPPSAEEAASAGRDGCDFYGSAVVPHIFLDLWFGSGGKLFKAPMFACPSTYRAMIAEILTDAFERDENCHNHIQDGHVMDDDDVHDEHDDDDTISVSRVSSEGEVVSEEWHLRDGR